MREQLSTEMKSFLDDCFLEKVEISDMLRHSLMKGKYRDDMLTDSHRSSWASSVSGVSQQTLQVPFRMEGAQSEFTF